MLSIPALQKDFIKGLERLSYSRHRWQAFSNWLEIAAITMHQLPYHSGDFPKDETFEALEAQYLKVINGYDRDELNVMSRMLGITMMAHTQSFSDFLGQIATEQELLNKDGGQFFTPYSVCKVIACTTLTDAHAVIEEKGIITISEPACGGGALVIACAEELLSQKIDPRSSVQFDCIDVSRDAFNMTYIQLSVLDLQAVVRHGNTLSMEFWEHRPTPQLRYFDQWLNERRAVERLEALRDLFVNPTAFFAEREEEEVQAEPITGVTQEEGEQTSLFDLHSFAPPTGKERTRHHRKADIVLPRDRQLNLFSEDQEGAVEAQ